MTTTPPSQMVHPSDPCGRGADLPAATQDVHAPKLEEETQDTSSEAGFETASEGGEGDGVSTTLSHDDIQSPAESQQDANVLNTGAEESQSEVSTIRIIADENDQASKAAAQAQIGRNAKMHKIYLAEEAKITRKLQASNFQYPPAKAPCDLPPHGLGEKFAVIQQQEASRASVSVPAVCTIPMGPHFYHQLLAEVEGEEQALSHDDYHYNATILTQIRDARLRRNLNALSVTEFFPIQLSAIQSIRAGHDVLIRSDPSTGKTLAFLAPTLDTFIVQHGALSPSDELTFNAAQLRIISTRKQKLESGCPIRPSMLIVCPTRELAQEHYELIKSLCDGTTVFPGLVHGQCMVEAQRRTLNQKCDVLVATTGRLAYLVQVGEVDLAQLRVLVFDEMHQYFTSPAQLECLKAIFLARSPSWNLTRNGKNIQRIIADAGVNWTWAKNAEPFLRPRTSELPIRKELFFKQPLRDHRTYQLVDVRCKSQEEFEQLCAQYVSQTAQKKAAVFFPRMRGIPAVNMFHRHLRELIPADRLVLKTSSHLSQEEREKVYDQFRFAEAPIVVCCNLLATGVNIPFLEQVFFIDFAQDNTEFENRAGRAGRNGNEGEIHLLANTAAKDYDTNQRCFISYVEGRKGALQRHDWPLVQIQSSNSGTSSPAAGEKSRDYPSSHLDSGNAIAGPFEPACDPSKGFRASGDDGPKFFPYLQEPGPPNQSRPRGSHAMQGIPTSLMPAVPASYQRQPMPLAEAGDVEAIFAAAAVAAAARLQRPKDKGKGRTKIW